MQGLLDPLEAGARETPERVLLRFVTDTKGSFEEYGWATAREWSLRAMAAYRQAGLQPGDRVVISLATSPELVAGLLGALRAGLRPALIAPLEVRNRELAEAEQRAQIGQLAPAAVVGAEWGDAVQIDPAAFLSTEWSAEDEALGTSLVESARYVQFSSGSTGLPKGLELTVPAIRSNLEMMRHCIPVSPEDRMCTWLPMYHDMGLFGTLLLPIWCRASTTMMDPSLFVRNPLSWLRAMDRHKGTFTAVPPSAVAALMRLLERRPQEDLDLSSCTRFICGAEQVTPTLVREWRVVMPRYGADADALKPVYGLAETTLAVTMPPLWRGQVIHEHAVGTTEEWVSVGQPVGGLVDQPLTGLEVELRDESGAEVPEGAVGRLHVRGPCLYDAVVEGGVATPRAEEWLDTGDLAFRVGREFCICGRAKEIIIKGGRNYSPERIEELAGMIEGVMRAAAFGVADEQRQTERVVLVCELHPRSAGTADARDALRLKLRSGLKSAGYELDEVHFTARGAIPRTTSGKIRRAACRELLAEEALPPVGGKQGAA